MRTIVVSILFAVTIVVVGGLVRIPNRVCLEPSFLTNHTGQVTVTALDGGASIISVKLESAPDLPGVTEEKDSQFREQLSKLSPELIFTNIEELRNSSEYVWSELVDGGRAYAQKHMVVYIKTLEGDWLSIVAPTYC